MVLTTMGRRSGERRSTTVAYVRTGDGYAVAALNLGSDRHPAWALNLRTDPWCEICVSGERLEMRGREAPDAEAERLWRQFFEQLPMIEDSLSLAARRVPVFVLEPA
jgi:F420H(2)-dependent quinone reductase